MAGVGLVILALLLLLVLGFPIAFSFGLASIIGIYLLSLDSSFFSSVAYQSLDSFPLMAIPMFILGGDIMRVGGLSGHLISFANALIGRFRGGLGGVMVVACMFFGAISGSSVATVAAIGSIMTPQMTALGWDKKYVAGLAASAGILGVLIPPSIPLILYGNVVGVSIGALFLGTMIPGIVMGLVFILVNYVIVSRKPQVMHRPEFVAETAATTTIISTKSFGRTFLVALPALLMPVVILGGIYGGVFTPTEAAAVVVVYSLLVGMFIYRGLKRGNLYSTISDSGTIIGVLMISIAFGATLSRILTMMEVPTALMNFIIGTVGNKYTFLLMVNVLLLLVGMFMDPNLGVLLFAPILYPSVVKMGVDPVHFGVIMVANLTIGMLTPPMAANLFVAQRVLGVPFADMFKHVMPYLAVSLVILALMTYFPQIVMWLPQTFQ